MIGRQTTSSPSQTEPIATIDQGFALKEALLADLRRARWRPGERLPTERQLCADHKVGRAVVRRALAEIKQLGLITQTVGSGTYVSSDAAERLNPPAVLSPAMLMEARLVLEPALIPLIIRNGTAADFQAIEECCRMADAAQTLDVFEHWDGEFHHLLARSTHNAFLIDVFAQISQARGSAAWGGLKRRSATPERRRLYGHQHRALLEALQDRDAAMARQALVEHLTDVARNMFE